MSEDVQKSYMRWHEIWLHAVTNPKAPGLGVLIRRPVASIRTALVWMVISGTIGVLFTAGLAQVLHPLARLSMRPSPDEITLGYRLLFFARSWGLSVAIGAVSLLLTTGMQHGFARLLKGRGRYTELVYLTAAYSAPLSIILAVFQSFLIRAVAIFAVIAIIVVLYQFALMIASMKAVYGFSSGKAWLAGTILPSIVILVLVFAGVYLVDLMSSPDAF